ncbi:MAG: terpene cyclase/mutase family protein [Planctomycetota bacterium]|nr:terpene cyclase/mutase family protein [Planctomycetota bacterium]
MRAWMAAVLCCTLVLCSGATAAADDAEREKAKHKAAADEEDFKARVNKAIERGLAWLRSQQRKDGSWPGFSEHLKPRQYNIMEVGLNALALMTLAHCGVEAEDDGVKRGIQFCKFHYAGGNGSWNLKGNNQVTIYTAATLIKALDALYRGTPKPKPLKRDRYGNVKPPKPVKCKYPTWVKKWIKELVEFIVRGQHESGGWRYPGNPLQAEDGETDLSNVQYALLALEAAASCGIVAPAETWLKAAEYCLKTQDKEGLETPVWILNPAWEPGLEETPKFLEVATAQARGWTYIPGQQAYPTASMTCAGVTCLALLKERLWLLGKLEKPLRKRLDQGIVDGLAWLSDVFTVENNVDTGGTPQMWHYYYLYGLERTGAKTGIKYVGQHDWYRLGAEHLMSAQQKSGGWKEADGQERPGDATESAITQTCFALLFLKRTTRKPLVPMTPPTLTGK